VRTHRDRDRDGSGAKRAGNTETDVVVAVVGLVPVAVRGAEVLWIVVPGTAAQNAGRRGPFRRRGATVRGPAAEEIRSSTAKAARVGPGTPDVSAKKRGKNRPAFGGNHPTTNWDARPCSGRKANKGKDVKAFWQHGNRR
jgi:hypothetical protein